MPTDALLLSVAVCAFFLIFALALAWIDHRTTSWQRSQASNQPKASAAAPIRKQAA